MFNTLTEFLSLIKEMLFTNLQKIGQKGHMVSKNKITLHANELQIKTEELKEKK